MTTPAAPKTPGPVDLCKLLPALANLLPAIRALVAPHGGTAEIRGYRTEPGIRVTIPNPASSFPLTIDAEMDRSDTAPSGSEWRIKAGSGSWNAYEPETLAMLASRIDAMAACDRVLSTINLDDFR